MFFYQIIQAPELNKYPLKYNGDEIDVFALGAVLYGMMSFKPIMDERAD